MVNLGRMPTPKRAIAGALSGLVGGVAHAIVNELDRKLLDYNADDMIMLGGAITDDVKRARKIGLVMHLNFSAIFGAVYGVVLTPRDEMDAFRKGTGFALTENFALFPLGVPLDKYHPHVRAGTCDRFFTPTSLVQATLRHIALGAGIGLSYPLLARKLGTGQARS